MKQSRLRSQPTSTVQLSLSLYLCLAVVRGGATGASHRKVLRDSVQGITSPAIRRLVRRAGVIRMSNLVYYETHTVLKVF
ncbi:hypothetical protein PI124_g10079 [Phytophthora idaei]|nr:hypothetical protein PI125_g16140 [Phytophthora idaei]KAG3144374.1 hypothetical protein PI126_g14203 [Phytophthora idaei]KAG3245158.1 hypothetical protein PI124_g10079 [Phytophthora idaei]